MGKRKNHNSNGRGGTAVLDPPEDIRIAAEPEPEPVAPESTGPIQGPILEPDEIAVYEHEHYQQICETTVLVRQSQERMENAKRASKLAKDSYDDAAADLLSLIGRGPQIPGRKWAKRVRLAKDVQADTELGKGFLPLTTGQEFDVHDIEGMNVAVLVQGVVNFLNAGEYEVIEWSMSPPKPGEVTPLKPKRIRMLVDVGNDEVGIAAEDSEHDAIVDKDGDVSISLGGDPYPLEAEEFEVIEWAAPVDPDGWRAVDIAELAKHGVKPALLEKVREAGISTIGKLCDFQNDGTELTSIEGIGPEKEAQIADAMIAWWAGHPEWKA